MKSPDRGDKATKKRKLARNTTSGQFETASPYDDPILFDELIKVVRAVRDLKPMVAATVLVFKQLGNTKSAHLSALVGLYLAVLESKALEDLAADPESLREVKKKRLEAKRLGNLPLEEQQRTQELARQWQLEDITPEKLIQANPQILAELMKLAAVLSFKTPHALPDDVSLSDGEQS